jgi:hypothetical protein
MSRFVAGGDSFTWGSDLPDCNEITPSKLTWSSLLGNRMGLDYHCVAKAGTSNHGVSRRVITELEKSSAEFVAVMWTYPSRSEIQLREDLNKELESLYTKHDIRAGDLDHGWLSLSVWHSIPYAEKIDRFGMNHDSWFLNKMKKQCDFYDAVGVSDLARNLFSIASEQNHVYDSVVSMFCLQSYLEKRSIPYVFAAATDSVLAAIDSHQLGRLMNMDRWLNTDLGFVEWAKRQGHEVSSMNHPSAAAHQDWLASYDP